MLTLVEYSTDKGTLERFVELRGRTVAEASRELTAEWQADNGRTAHIVTLSVYGVRTSVYRHTTDSNLVLVYRYKNGMARPVSVEPIAKWQKYVK